MEKKEYRVDKKYRIWRTSGWGKTIRRKLWRLDPHCFWCDIETEWYNPADGILKDDSATLDHLVSRNYRERGEPCDVVISCHRCNQIRNEEETEAMPWEEKVKRGGAIPRTVRGNS